MRLRKCLLLACLGGVGLPVLSAQTTLFPGDLAVLSINADNGFCSGFVGEDRINLVFFKDITPGTTLDLTDNGWERENPGFFGNEEAAFRFTRTGARIPAGTVVTLVLPNVGGQVRFASPDNDWTLTRLSTQNTNVNLDNGGDQIIFMQGGTWDDGDTGGGNFLNNARYTGGRFLFAGNTKDVWAPLQNTNGDSGLPAALDGCYQLISATGSANYLFYDGPEEMADPLTWLTRLTDSSNWLTTVGCGSFPFPPSQISLDNDSLGVECTICQSCAPYQEELLFTLPPAAGPYDLRLVVNTDTVTVTDYFPGATYPVAVSGATRIELIAIQDAAGCAIRVADTLNLDLQTGEGIAVTPPPIQRACDQGSGTSGFNLIALENNLRRSAADTVVWFADSLRTQPITVSSNFLSNSRTLYAEVQNGLCSSGLLPVVLEVAPVPRISALGDGFVCPGECHEVEFQLRGAPPFTLQYELRINDTWQPFFLFSETGDTTLQICPDFGQATEIGFRSLSDQSCVTALSTTFDLPVYPPAINLVTDTLCPGESLILNGVRYDEANPLGRDTLRGAGAHGCDSIIVVDLTFITPAAAVSITGPDRICPGDTVDLLVQLPDDQPYTLTYQEDAAAPTTIAGVQGNYTFSVHPLVPTTWQLLRLEPEVAGCTLELEQSTTITVNDLAVAINIAEEPGCDDEASGRLQAAATGGIAPYQFRWSTGEQEFELNGAAPGMYSVSVTDAAGCRQSTTAILAAPEPLSATIQEEPAVCPGEEDRVIIQRITGGSGSFRYSFDGRTFLPVAQFPLVITDIPPLANRLFLDDGGSCSLEEPLQLLNSTTVATIDLGGERIIQRGDSVVLNAALNFSPVRLLWSNTGTLSIAIDSLSAVARPERTTIYRLTATTASGCMLTQTVRVVVEEPDQIYYAPNAFSPNNDGRNDYFTIYGGAELRQISVLRIFNRWGTLVFEGLDLAPGVEEEGWNGAQGNTGLPTGVYVYQAELLTRSGQRILVSGSFILMR